VASKEAGVAIMQMPKRVSVVISNYNYARFLAEAIDSALDQSYTALEVIVVDDASTDHSRDVLRAYEGRVELVLQAQNEGQISAYNCGFARCTGEIVVFLDADDRLRPGAIAEIVDAFAPGVTKVHWRAGLIDVAGEGLGVQVPAKLVAGDMSGLLSRRGILYPSSPGSANAYLASALRQIMPLPTSAVEKHGADFFAIYGVALLGLVAIAGKGRALSDYRVHRTVADPSSLSFGNAAQGYREGERQDLRSEVYQRWVTQWSRNRIHIQRSLTEFSIEKNTFSHAVFAQSGYWSGLSVGLSRLRKMVRCIRYRPSSMAEKTVLTAMILAILVLPRPTGIHVAKYLCDPSSR
jgi:glycosyltransferase involved in cell wall biosynthesis